MNTSPAWSAHLPDVDRLRAALAVRDEGSVTRAADRLRLTQPAVSRLVASLEAELGFPLFARERRRLVLTDRGRSYLAEAEASVGSLLRLSALGRELRLGGHGLLRIATVSVLAHGVLPRALQALQRDFPEVAVEINEVERDLQVQGLLAGRFDLGLLALPAGAPGLRVELLADTEAVCLLPADHPLAARLVLEAAELAGERFIAHREGKLMRQRVDDAFGHMGNARRVGVTADSTPLAALLVAAGLGFAIVHPLPGFALPPGVISRPFRPRLSFGYAAIVRPTEQSRQLNEALLGHLRRILAEEDLCGATTGRAADTDPLASAAPEGFIWKRS
jgi:DNA-binding transcriptional LysR family regulator